MTTPEPSLTVQSNWYSDAAFLDIRPSVSLTPVVCLPGFLCSPASFLWAGAEILGAAPAQILPEPWMLWPGLRIAEITERVADHIRAQRLGSVIVAAHSAAGPLALMLSLAHPESVAAMLLINTGPSYRDHLDVHVAKQQLLERHAWEGRFIEEYVASCFAYTVDESLVSHMADYARRVDHAHAARILAELMEIDLEPRLNEVTVPTAIVHGTRDRSRPVVHAHRLAAGLPHAHLSLIPCGHTPMVEQPDSIAAALTRIIPDRSVAQGSH